MLVNRELIDIFINSLSNIISHDSITMIKHQNLKNKVLIHLGKKVCLRTQFSWYYSLRKCWQWTKWPISNCRISKTKIWRFIECKKSEEKKPGCERKISRKPSFWPKSLILLLKSVSMVNDEGNRQFTLLSFFCSENPPFGLTVERTEFDVRSDWDVRTDMGELFPFP